MLIGFINVNRAMIKCDNPKCGAYFDDSEYVFCPNCHPATWNRV